MSIPKKLTAFLDALSPEERAEKLRLFEEAATLAQQNGLQSPRFWASRQIIKDRTLGQIKHDIAKRVRHRPPTD